MQLLHLGGARKMEWGPVLQCWTTEGRVPAGPTLGSTIVSHAVALQVGERPDTGVIRRVKQICGKLTNHVHRCGSNCSNCN